MTQPDDTPQVLEGTDVRADPDNLEVADLPPTSDPEAMTDQGTLGGAGGHGGAG